ncbi:MAG: hypothetical protein HOP29_16565, partial [Phycisphaerales bacterium]|nr:hypothetical protein [Phycisphaerales bacterium]
MLPVQAHVAHLRHAARPAIVQTLLFEQFKLSKSESKRIAPLLANHIDQGIRFHEASLVPDHRVRAVLQYYSYLNFATAVVMAYRPSGHQNVGRHGLVDRTRSIQKLDMASVVVEIQDGATPLFHSIVSERTLSGTKLRLKQICVPVSMLSAELASLFSIELVAIRVLHGIEQSGTYWHSFFHFHTPIVKDIALRHDVRRKAIERAIPWIGKDYVTTKSSKGLSQKRVARRYTVPGMKARKGRCRDARDGSGEALALFGCVV